MKKVLLFIGISIVALQAIAQNALPTYKIGVFAPMHLDSLFNSSGYRYGKEIPKFAMPAIEFVQGAQVALDSLNVWDENVEAFIYDTRSYTKPLSALIRNGSLDSMHLLIGAVRDVDYKQLAEFALRKNIPFISVTFPNDGNITANPFTVIMNSTLKAHCEGIYSYLLQNHGPDKIMLFRRKGDQEDRLAGYFKAINEQDGKPLLNIQTVIVDSTVSSELFVKKLDSNRQNIIIGGSLDESFALNLASACNDWHKQYPTTLIGMPNWDGFRSLLKRGSFEEFPIYFTTPYFNSKWDRYSKMLIAAYQKKYKNRPSDIAYKGFEAVYSFTRLLIKYPDDFMSHLNDKTYKVFCDYNFRPVISKKNAGTPDYIENKHLYFIKILNGSVSKAW